MEKRTATYCSLEALAATLQLPQGFLRELALQGDIPYLNVRGKLRFNPNEVQKRLDRIASKKGGKEGGRP